MEKSEVSYLHHSNNIKTRELLMTWCAVLAVFFYDFILQEQNRFPLSNQHYCLWNAHSILQISKCIYPRKCF